MYLPWLARKIEENTELLSTSLATAEACLKQGNAECSSRALTEAGRCITWLKSKGVQPELEGQYESIGAKYRLQAYGTTQKMF